VVIEQTSFRQLDRWRANCSFFTEEGIPENCIAYERFGTYFAKGAVWQADICRHMLNGPIAGRA
jgi:hypothetical protein